MVSISRPGRGIVAPLFTPARIKAEKLMKRAKAEGKTLSLAEALAIANGKAPIATDPTANERLRAHLMNKGIIAQPTAVVAK